jgi:ABC-type glycerol-3-phosphate transport system permease component
MELEITTKRVIRVWWSYFWRNIATIFVAAIIAVLIGMISGFAGVDLSSPSMHPLLTAFGILVCVATSLIPIQMILGKDFGEFRLVLLAKATPPTY